MAALWDWMASPIVAVEREGNLCIVSVTAKVRASVPEASARFIDFLRYGQGLGYIEQETLNPLTRQIVYSLDGSSRL